MKKPLYWPPISSDAWIGWILGTIGFLGSCVIIAFFGLWIYLDHSARVFPTSLLVFGCGGFVGSPFITILILGFINVRNNNDKRERNLRIRQDTVEELRSELISEAGYVGGHPLIPQVDRVVLSLVKPVINIYKFGPDYEIIFATNINLVDIRKVRMGRPKSAKEIYDEDSGYSIDVYEQSPFFNIIFVLDGHTYQASFENFESPYTPRSWYNKITTMQHQIRTEN